MKTWAPKGETPVLQYSFNWQQLSLMAGVSFWRLYFRFFHGAIKGPQIVEFLKALKDTIGGKLLIIWDGLPAHRSRLVGNYVDSLEGQIQLERLPAYAPEINPAEYVFGYAKQRELANLCVDTIEEVRLRNPTAEVDAASPQAHQSLLAAGGTGPLTTSSIY